MADCKHCGRSLPAGASGFVTACEKCFIDIAFPGATAGIMLDTAQATTAGDPAATGKAAVTIAFQAPKPAASDLRIASALDMTPATVRGARLYNPDTYSLLTDLEARKRRRDVPATGRLLPTQAEQAKRDGRKAGFIFSAVTIIVLWAYQLIRG